ncbi:MAG: transcriptional regulator NrdR [Mariprofundaceae bacterium]|nr:transcriptional regulator NrdR [Mariprofundaceae bacterium]
MHCPYCAYAETRVVDSREAESGGAVRRRRSCEGCGKRFSTFERADVRLPMLIKKDKSRQPFNVNKMRRGMERALEKRPVPVADIDQAVMRIMQSICETGNDEIAVRLVGEFVMRELKTLDAVAYVRFASVYRNFKDVGEFLVAVQSTLPTSMLK